MHPSLGRIVHVAVDPLANNGSPVAPGIIVRVWDERTLSVQAFLDNPIGTRLMGPLSYVADLPEPPAEMPLGSAWIPAGVWTWPPRY